MRPRACQRRRRTPVTPAPAEASPEHRLHGLARRRSARSRLYSDSGLGGPGRDPRPGRGLGRRSPLWDTTPRLPAGSPASGVAGDAACAGAELSLPRAGDTRSRVRLCRGVAGAGRRSTRRSRPGAPPRPRGRPPRPSRARGAVPSAYCGFFPLCDPLPGAFQRPQPASRERLPDRAPQFPAGCLAAENVLTPSGNALDHATLAWDRSQPPVLQPRSRGE